MTLGLSLLAAVGGVALLPAADARQHTAPVAAGPVLDESSTVAAEEYLSASIIAASAAVPPPLDPATGSPVVATAFAAGLPDGRAATAIAAAMAQIGLPYVWGGDGPMAGDAGFDCSGLTTYAYGVAGIRLPRTAHTQYHAGPRVPAGAPLQPGDLVFYGTTARVHHVGMYIGDGRMVNAPRRGKPVQVAYYRWRGDDYLGASRPAVDGPLGYAPLPYVPPVPVPEAPIAPPEFVAPPAPLPPVLPAPTDAQPPEPETAARAVEESAPLVPEVPVSAAVPRYVTAPPVGALPGAGSSTQPTGEQAPGDAPGPGTSGVSQATGVTPAASAAAPTTAQTEATTPPAASTTDSATTTAALPTTTPPPTIPAATEPEPVRAVSAVLPGAGGTVELSSVRRGRDGLPRAPGIWTRGSRSVIRLADAASGSDTVAGSVITVRYSDETRRSFTVRSAASASTGDAAAAVDGVDGSLVVLVPADDNSRWRLVIAG